MTYKELELKYPSQEFGEINIKRKADCRVSGEWDYDNVADDGWEIFLNHSCDEWIIGTVADAEKFYQDLEKALEYCRNNP